MRKKYNAVYFRASKEIKKKCRTCYRHRNFWLTSWECCFNYGRDWCRNESKTFLCHSYIQMIRTVICIEMFGLKLYSQDMFPWYSSLSENNSNGCHSILYMPYSDSTADTFIAKPTVAIKHQSNSVSFPPVFVPNLAAQLGRSNFYAEISHQAWEAPILNVLSFIIVELNRKSPSKSYRVRRRGGCELVNIGSA